jgi:hypothetical protein
LIQDEADATGVRLNEAAMRLMAGYQDEGSDSFQFGTLPLIIYWLRNNLFADDSFLQRFPH